MTLHPALLDEMLTDEVEATRLRLGARFESIEKVGPDVHVRLGPTSVGGAIVRFASRGYDAEPFQVAIVTHDGDIAPQAQGPAGLFHSVHPILDRGFVCSRAPGRSPSRGAATTSPSAERVTGADPPE